MTKVLLVEDEEAQQELVVDILAPEGYKVFCVSSAAEILEKIIEVDPKIIITDLVLPDMDGFKLIQLIHKNFPHIKILAYSGHTTENTFEGIHNAAILLGANDFIGKPYDIDLFKARIRRLT